MLHGLVVTACTIVQAAEQVERVAGDVIARGATRDQVEQGLGGLVVAAAKARARTNQGRFLFVRIAHGETLGELVGRVEITHAFPLPGQFEHDLVVGRITVMQHLPFIDGLDVAAELGVQHRALGTPAGLQRKPLDALIEQGERFPRAAELAQAPQQGLEAGFVMWCTLERAAVLGDRVLVAAKRSVDVTEAKFASQLEVASVEQGTHERLGLGRAVFAQQELPERIARVCLAGLQLQRTAERLLGERDHAPLDETATERESDRGVVRRKVGRARQVFHRRIDVLAIERDHAETGIGLRILLDTQRGAEVLLGEGRISVEHGDMAQRGMRAGAVRIERERLFVGSARPFDVAELELYGAKHEQQARLFGRELMGAPDQRRRLLEVAARAAHDSQQTQGLAVIRIRGEQLAVALLGLFKAALAVQFEGFFSGHGHSVWEGRGRTGTVHYAARRRFGPQDAACLRARLSGPHLEPNPPEPPPMGANQDLATLLRARTPLLVVETPEEKRVIESFRHAIAQSLRPLYQWSITDGLRRLDMDDDEIEGLPDATLTLTTIKQRPEPAVFLLLDFQPYLRYTMTLRLLREIVLRQDAAEHTLVLVGARIELPDDLAPMATRFELALPDADALAKIVREEAFNYSREHGRRVEVDPEAARTVVRNLRGLTVADARRIVRKLIYADGALGPADLPELAKAKFALLDRDNLLHFEYETARFTDVAGLGRLKRWIAQREPAFVGRKMPVRLDPPKGILLLGVQGCGKSLAAKAVAGGFGVPLLRLDIGALYNKYHGETERNLRGALKSAELLAPCVLWLDEIEKALATAGNDDGVSRRVLGYLLTWMAERKTPVFLVATANDVQALPPELLRKGRFDEIFFVDLPDEATRVELVRIHLAKRDLDPAQFDLAEVARASAGFSGAEIEQLVVAGLYAAAAANRPLDTAHLIDEARATRPLSVMMASQVEALRAWARERTVPAD